MLRRAFYNLSSGMLLYGDEAKSYAVEVGIPASKLAVVGNSIFSESSLSALSEAQSDDPEDNGAFRIIMSARLTSRHRLDLVAEALSVMPKNGLIRPVSVVVIGDGSERPYLEAAFTDRGIDAEFVGSVYGAEAVAAYYAAADVAVSPRASGLNIVQAMGFGVPVVAPDSDPTSGPELELVVNGLTGYRFRLDDVEDLAGELARLRDEPDKAAQMGMAAKARVFRTHTAEAHAQAIEHALRSWLPAESSPGLSDVES